MISNNVPTTAPLITTPTLTELSSLSLDGTLDVTVAIVNNY